MMCNCLFDQIKAGFRSQVVIHEIEIVLMLIDLFKGLLVEGSVEIKCKHCHTLSSIEASRFERLLCMVDPCPNRVPHEPEK